MIRTRYKPYSKQEGLSPLLQLIPKNHKNQLWIQRVESPYYVDSDYREYDILFLPNRINQFSYWAVVKLRNIRSIFDLDDYSDTTEI